MKRNLVIIRFGATTPLKHETLLVTQTLVEPEDSDLAIACSFHDMGLVSIVHTKFTPKEVAFLFEKIAAETGDVLPVVVFDLDSEGAGAHLGDISNFRKLLDNFQQMLLERQDAQPAGPTRITMTLDDLLDLANRRGGVDQLNEEERTLLEKLSKDL